MQTIIREWEDTRTISQSPLGLPILIQVPLVRSGYQPRFSGRCSQICVEPSRPRIRRGALRTIGILPILLAGLVLASMSGPARTEQGREWGQFPIAATSQWSSIGTEFAINHGDSTAPLSQAATPRVVQVALAGYLLPADRPEDLTDEAH